MVARDASGGALDRCCIAARLFACAGAPLPRGELLRAGCRGERKFCARSLLRFGFGRPGPAPLLLGFPGALDGVLDDPAGLADLLGLVRPGEEAARGADLVRKDLCTQVAQYPEQAGRRFQQPALAIEAEDQLGETAQVGRELFWPDVVVESHDGSGWSRQVGTDSPDLGIGGRDFDRGCGAGQEQLERRADARLALDP